TTSTSASLTGLTCSTSYSLEVEAFDASANTSPRAKLGASTVLCGPPTGLVAEYSFDQGSGTTVNDISGNNHNGTINNATWTTSGRYGGALSFNGTSASVDLGALGTFYNTAFTLEAWVQKQSADKNDVGILGSWNPNANGGPMIWVDHVATHYYGTFGNGL